MKTVLILVLFGIVGYFGYQHFKSDDDAAPDVIENPVYADMRLDMRVGDRDLQFALFGKMASEADCNQRSTKVWGKVIEGCRECIQRASVCKTELDRAINDCLRTPRSTRRTLVLHAVLRTSATVAWSFSD